MYKTEQEAIDAATKAVVDADELIDFAGHNCSEEANCLGWDGVDSRCDCGNRRVYWAITGDTQIGYTALAMAY